MSWTSVPVGQVLKYFGKTVLYKVNEWGGSVKG